MNTTSNPPAGHARGSPAPFGWLGWDGLQLAAVPGFLAIYFLVEHDRSLAPLSVLTLLVCVLARLNDEKRRMAAIPVSLAALMLAGRVGAYAAANSAGSPRPELEQPGVGWLPLFFSACIFLTPELKNYTGRLMMSMAVLLLVSGLLPGEGFEVIFITCQYFLFLAIVTGLSIDFTRYLVANGNSVEKAT